MTQSLEGRQSAGRGTDRHKMMLRTEALFMSVSRGKRG